MPRKKTPTMSKKEILRQAADTRAYLRNNPTALSAGIISAKHADTVDTFKPEDLIDRADKNAETRVKDALRALSQNT